MGCDPAGMDRVNLHALVIYIPDPLGEFLDDLRLELVPHCMPHAHVSVLPPRILRVPPGAAVEQIRTANRDFSPFEVELGGVEVFPVTDVIYLSVRSDAAAQLRRMHATLNRAGLQFAEPFTYHPHVTLGQELPPSSVGAMHELAVKRWAQYKGARHFRAETMIFVQNTEPWRWLDLAEFALGAVTVP